MRRRPAHRPRPAGRGRGARHRPAHRRARRGVRAARRPGAERARRPGHGQGGHEAAAGRDRRRVRAGPRLVHEGHAGAAQDADRGRWPRGLRPGRPRHVDRRPASRCDPSRPVPRLRPVTRRPAGEARRHAPVQGAPDLRGRRDRALDRPGGLRRAGADPHAHGERSGRWPRRPHRGGRAGVGAGRSGDGRRGRRRHAWPSSPSPWAPSDWWPGSPACSPPGGEAHHEPPARSYSSPARRSRCPRARRRTRRSSRSARPPAAPPTAASARSAWPSRAGSATRTSPCGAPPGAR